MHPWKIILSCASILSVPVPNKESSIQPGPQENLTANIGFPLKYNAEETLAVKYRRNPGHPNHHKKNDSPCKKSCKSNAKKCRNNCGHGDDLCKQKCKTKRSQCEESCLLNNGNSKMDTSRPSNSVGSGGVNNIKTVPPYGQQNPGIYPQRSSYNPGPVYGGGLPASSGQQVQPSMIQQTGPQLLPNGINSAALPLTYSSSLNQIPQTGMQLQQTINPSSYQIRQGAGMSLQPAIQMQQNGIPLQKIRQIGLSYQEPIQLQQGMPIQQTIIPSSDVHFRQGSGVSIQPINQMPQTGMKLQQSIIPSSYQIRDVPFQQIRQTEIPYHRTIIPSSDIAIRNGVQMPQTGMNLQPDNRILQLQLLSSAIERLQRGNSMQNRRDSPQAFGDWMPPCDGPCDRFSK